MRITRDEYLLNEVFNAAKRSTCLRLQVGAVLVRDGRPILAGYNGALSGFPHCTPDTCGPDKPCSNTVHAEVNLIYFAARHGISTLGSTLWCTDSPCKICAEAIIQAGIQEVVFFRRYRVSLGLALLTQAGVKWTQCRESECETCHSKGFTKTETGCFFCEDRVHEEL